MAFAHKVCFGCRKSWSTTYKRWRRCRIDSDNPVYCPECHEPLVGLGRFFEPPKKSNIRQWRKVEAIFRAGFDFASDAMPENPSMTTTVFSDVMRRMRQSPDKRLAGKFKTKASNGCKMF